MQNDNKELLEDLLAHGASINVRMLPQDYATPSCVQNVHWRYEKAVYKRGRTRLGYKSALFIACEFSAWRCVPVLLNHGADPHWTDPFSRRNVTPTLLAYKKNPSKTLLCENRINFFFFWCSEMLDLFIAKGAGGTDKTRWVLSEVLAAAVLQDDFETVRWLVRPFAISVTVNFILFF